MNLQTEGLVCGLVVLLGVATFVLRALSKRDDLDIDTAILRTFRLRVQAWWWLCAVLAGAFLIGKAATVILFGLISFWALREFITLTPTRRGDHRALFWVFALFTPLQFIMVGLGNYELYSILIPVYAFLFIPARIAMAGDYRRFLERSAKIQAGLLICVYCLSHAPALLAVEDTLPPAPQPTVEESTVEESTAEESTEQPVEESPESVEYDWDPNALLLFFLIIVQLSDALQYAWSQIPSRHVIAPSINPSKTWEGLLGGTASVTLIGAMLWWATPFQGVHWWMAAAMSTVISLMGFAGALTMSAIKRDRGVKDYGTLVEGHGGVLDRIDSTCFAAPVFFHLTRYWLSL